MKEHDELLSITNSREFSRNENMKAKLDPYKIFLSQINFHVNFRALEPENFFL
jgi:hypothetical protein